MSNGQSANSLAGKRLVIYFPLLRGGGAERLYINLAPFFLNAGLSVTFLLERAEGALLDSIPSGINVEVLDAPRLRQAIPRLVTFLKRHQPDLFFSSITLNNIASLWAKALAGGPTRVIVSQHNALTREATHGGVFRALPILYRLFIRWAHAVVAVSNGVANDLIQTTGLASSEIDIIPNGVITPEFARLMAEPCDHPWLKAKEKPVLLAVGRLTAQKDFATLLRAFAELRSRLDARLIILGEGDLRTALQDLASSLRITDVLDMPGFLPNPLPFMRSADALVLSSSHEGFGLVLAEALGCGTPVVSTDCQFGPAEILENGRFGELVAVGDPGGLAEALIRTVKDPLPRELLIKRGQEFSVAGCAQQYLSLFERVLAD